MPATIGTDRAMRPRLRSLGTSGSGTERGLEAAYLALSDPLINTTNAGFLRNDAALARRELEAWHRPDAPPEAVALAWEKLEHPEPVSGLGLGAVARAPASVCLGETAIVISSCRSRTGPVAGTCRRHRPNAAFGNFSARKIRTTFMLFD